MGQWLFDLYSSYESTLGYIGINGLFALSVYATLCCGQLALGNAGFAAVGAYAATLCTMQAHLPFALALGAGATIPALLAVPLGLPVLRLKGVFLAIATLGFGEVVRIVLVNWDYVNGAQGIVAIPRLASLPLIYLVLAA